MCVRVVARLPQRLKSTFYEKNFITPQTPFWAAQFKKKSNMLILALETKSAATFQN